MRTITSTLKKNLEAQKTEAETIGLTKVAKNITSQLESQTTRENEEEYSYTANELLEDVEFLFSKAALRVQDYYNKASDQKKAAALIQAFAAEFIDAFAGNESPVGPYEPKVPGEAREQTEFEVE